MPRTSEGYHYDNFQPSFNIPRNWTKDALALAIQGDNWDFNVSYRVVLIPKGYLYQLVPSIKEDTL